MTLVPHVNNLVTLVTPWSHAYLFKNGFLVMLLDCQACHVSYMACLTIQQHSQKNIPMYCHAMQPICPCNSRYPFLVPVVKVSGCSHQPKHGTDPVGDKSFQRNCWEIKAGMVRLNQTNNTAIVLAVLLSTTGISVSCSTPIMHWGFRSRSNYSIGPCNTELGPPPWGPRTKSRSKRIVFV